MSKLLKIGNNLTVILNDGSKLINTNVSQNIFVDISNALEAGDDSLVKRLMVPELCKEEQKIVVEREFRDNINEIINTGLFYTKGNALYRKGIDISIPKILAEEYYRIWMKYSYAISIEQYQVEKEDILLGDAEFKAIDNFWMWCSLNPNPESRESLYEWLGKGNFQITNNGFIVAYRNVSVKNEGNKELTEFISKCYTKIKLQKKSPKNYWVYLNDDKSYSLLCYEPANDGIGKIEGNLQDLYLDLPNVTKTIYTDNHTRTMEIVFGQLVSMDRNKCNQSKFDTCSSGLICSPSV